LPGCRGGGYSAVCYDVQSKLSQLQQLQQKTEMELLDARMFSASLENELDDEDASGITHRFLFSLFVFLFFLFVFLFFCEIAS